MSRSKQEARARRRARIRKGIRGFPDRPRLSVFRSNAHIYAQVIDDDRGHTLASASSLEDDVVGDDLDKTTAAHRVGEAVAERALTAGVTRVVFDRGGFRYAGRVRTLAEAAREGGLDF